MTFAHHFDTLSIISFYLCPSYYTRPLLDPVRSVYCLLSCAKLILIIIIIFIDFVGIKRAGDECYTTARETSGLCRITIEKANEMVQFGQELQTTLDDVTGSSTSKSSSSRGIGSMDASKFAIIQDLMDGDRIQSATNLARELSELSLKCVDKSQEMILSMERGIDALPDAIGTCFVLLFLTY